MTRSERKMIIALLDRVRTRNTKEAVEFMWQQGLFDVTAVEQLYIGGEVQRRVRYGETKTNAMSQLSAELNCSYEKIRSAVYKKNRIKEKN